MYCIIQFIKNEAHVPVFKLKNQVPLSTVHEITKYDMIFNVALSISRKTHKGSAI